VCRTIAQTRGLLPADEAAAGLGLMVDLVLADAAAVAELDAVLDRIRAMLFRLAQRAA
jgi:hypothetical protein